MIKNILTTGEVAKYCHVNFRTVIRWIERGMLESYKLPGRGDNRIHTSTLVEFLHTNNMPIHEDLLASKVLIYTESGSFSQDLLELDKNLRIAGWESIFTTNPIHLGFSLAKSSPAAIVMTNPEYLEQVASIVISSAESQNNAPKIILLSKDEYQVQDGVDALIARDAYQVLSIVEQEQAA